MAYLQFLSQTQAAYVTRGGFKAKDAIFQESWVRILPLQKVCGSHDAQKTSLSDNLAGSGA